MRSKVDIEHAIDTYGDTVWRACVLYFKQAPDAQDAFQETFLKYSETETSFNSEEHRKAWLIRVATNVCKDMLKAAHRKNLAFDGNADESWPISGSSDIQPGSDLYEVLNAMRALADPPRTPVFLSLYEGYTAGEIAEILDAPVNTVYSWIARGKQQLKEVLR
ncbi:MAG: RNA polymerase sigma factor [Raoultibacter sp.]|jgi:RNA polymerase sigma factor (sigma-70 family)